MLRSLTMIAALLLAGCGAPDAGDQGGDAPSRDASALGIRNFSAPLPNVLCSGQPTKEQFDALRAAGVTRVLHLRRKNESGSGWEEARAAEAGVQFERLEVAGGPGLTRENVEAFAAKLQSYGDDKVLVSCASSNRVGAMFALKAVWLEGADQEEAMALGTRAGMKSLTGTVEKLLAK